MAMTTTAVRKTRSMFSGAPITGANARAKPTAAATMAAAQA
jgi:hypothetical protein